MSDSEIRALTSPAARLRSYAEELADTGEAGSLEVAQDIRAVLAELEAEHLGRLKATIALCPFAAAADSPHAQQFGVGVHGEAFKEAKRIVVASHTAATSPAGPTFAEAEASEPPL